MPEAPASASAGPAAPAAPSAPANLKGATVEKRVLLHLLEHNRGAEAFEVDFALSQAGVARGLGVARPAAARSLIKLARQGLVAERTAHVRGSRRQRKVYALTEAGLAAAREVREGLLSAVVEAPGPEGGLQRVAVGELLAQVREAQPKLGLAASAPWRGGLRERPARLADVGLAALVSAIRQGVYDPKRLPGAAGAGGGLRSLEFSRAVPKPRYFYGREQELAALEAALKGGQVRAFVVTGMAGIGKTTLLAQLAHTLRREWNVYWFQAGRWSGARSFIVSLGEFLARAEGGGGALAKALEGGEPMRGLLEALGRDLAGSRTLLVVDDAHRADREFYRLLRALLGVLEGLEGLEGAKGAETVLVVAGRSVAPFYDRRHVRLQGSVMELKLEGLEGGPSRELLQTTWGQSESSPEPAEPGEEELALLLEVTRGHPLALELLRPAGSLKGSGLRGALADFNTFLEEEVGGELAPGELALLKGAAVFRRPVPAEALLDQPQPEGRLGGSGIEGQGGAAGGGEAAREVEALQGVVAKSLLLEEGGLYYLHDALREFFGGRSTPRERQAYHAQAATYYGRLYGGLAQAPPDSRLEEEAGLEMVFHLLEAGAVAEAAEHLLEVGEELVGQGTVEVAELLDRVPEGAVEPELWRELLELKGDAAARTGNLDTALAHYAQDLAQVEEGSPAKAQVLAKMGAVEAQRGETEQALKLQRESLAIFRAHGDRLGVARTLNERGLTLKRAGQWEAAQEAYQEGLATLKGLSEREAPARDRAGLSASIWTNLGALHEAAGRTGKALQAYGQAYDLAAVGENREVLLAASLAQGELLAARGRAEAAIGPLERARQLAQEAGLSQRLRVELALLEVERTRGGGPALVEGLSRVVEVLEGAADSHEKSRERSRGRLTLSRRAAPAANLSEGLKLQLGRAAGVLEEVTARGAVSGGSTGAAGAGSLFTSAGAERVGGPAAQGGMAAPPPPLELVARSSRALARLGEHLGAGRLAMAVGRAALGRRAAAEALDHFAWARRWFAQGAEAGGEAAACYHLGRTLLALGPAGDQAEARRHLERALALSRRAGLAAGVDAAEQALADLEGR